MIRVSLLEHINNCLLSGLINLADKIIRPFARYPYLIQIERGTMVVPLESGVRKKEQCGDSSIAGDAQHCK
jgi:hypothetical protein